MKWQFKWDKRFLQWGITAFLVIAGSIIFYLVISRLPNISISIRHILAALAPITYGLVFAYLLNKLMMFFENRLCRHLMKRRRLIDRDKAQKHARTISVVLTVFCVLVVVGGTLALVIPQTVVSVENLINRLPFYYNEGVALARRVLNSNTALEETIVQVFGNMRDNLTNWLRETFIEQMNQMITNFTTGVVNVLKEIASIIIGIILSIYILYNKDTLSAQLKRLLFGFFKPSRANRILRNTRFLDKTVGGFFLGKVIESIIVGIISYFFLVALSMPYAVLIALLLGLTNIVPFFGSYIGAIPSAFMILLENPLKCLIFIIYIVVLHLFANNILSPRVQGETIGLGGFWILFAILLFGGLFGFWGMLLGVPVFAVIYTAVSKFNTTQLKQKNYPTQTKDYTAMQYIDPDTGQPVYHTQPSGEHSEGNTSENNDTETRVGPPKSN